MDLMFRTSSLDLPVFSCTSIKPGKNVEIYPHAMVGSLYEKSYFVQKHLFLLSCLLSLLSCTLTEAPTWCRTQVYAIASISVSSQNICCYYRHGQAESKTFLQDNHDNKNNCLHKIGCINNNNVSCVVERK